MKTLMLGMILLMSNLVLAEETVLDPKRLKVECESSVKEKIGYDTHYYGCFLYFDGDLKILGDLSIRRKSKYGTSRSAVILNQLIMKARVENKDFVLKENAHGNPQNLSNWLNSEGKMLIDKKWVDHNEAMPLYFEIR